MKDREAWHTAAHGVTESWTRLANNKKASFISKLKENTEKRLKKKILATVFNTRKQGQQQLEN